MEFKGRIAKLLPMRSGTSQRTGNEWKSLPFVFEYFENETDRWADSVVLETFDTKVIDNLKEGMEVICGFGHKAKDIKKQDGTDTTINEIRLYKIESIRKPAQQPQVPQGNVLGGPQTPPYNPYAQQPFPPQVDANGNPQNKEGGNADDLLF